MFSPAGRIKTDRSCLLAKRRVAYAVRVLSRASSTWARLSLGVFIAGTLAFSLVARASDIVSYAIVQDDDSPASKARPSGCSGSSAADRAKEGALPKEE